MTALERVAAAIAKESGFVTKVGQKEFLRHARGALTAIREPSPAMCRAGDQAGSAAVAKADEWAAHDCNVHESQPPAMFTAMIDQILNGGD